MSCFDKVWWKLEGILDKSFVAGALLMDLSKAFDCIRHDLLVAKLHAYGITLNTANFIYSFLKHQKQNVKIHVCSSFQTSLWRVPKGPVLGPILFNIFLNDLLVVLKKLQLYNIADYNTISAEGDNTDDLLKMLKEESESPAKLFRENNMILNRKNFKQ